MGQSTFHISLKFPPRGLAALALLLLGTMVARAEHPFLLVRQDQFAELAARASQQPWLGMKNEAVSNCLNLQYASIEDPCPGTPFGPSHCMRHIMSACGLAYIVDPANKTAYVNKVVSVLPRWEDILSIQSGADDGTRDTSNTFYNIAGAAYFNTLLALDVMHADLAARPWSSPLSYPTNFSSQLAYAEFLMEQEFNHFYGITKPVYDFVQHNGATLAYHMPSRHPPAQEAILIHWLIYKGSFSAIDSDSRALLFGGMLNNQYPDQDGDGRNIGGYLPEVSARINGSGVYTEGPGYALAGWGSDRDERAHLPDVLEFTGKDVEFGIDFYTNPRWQTFFEWLYGYASTPFGMNASFGDTYAFRRMNEEVGYGAVFGQSSRIASAGKFGVAAGSYALWKAGGLPPEGMLLHYLLLNPGTAASTPPSRIFTNGGAFFLEQPAVDRSLYGVLWNVRQPEDGTPVFHIREDVNAIYIAGYGAPLLMNGGFCGSSSPAGPDPCAGTNESGTLSRFSGIYLGDRAASNNTALVNYALSTLGDGGNTNPYNVPDEGQPDKFGSGVLEGFLGNGVEYAAASSRYRAGPVSTDALANGEHQRSFVFVQPEGGANGYYVLFDEFSEVSQGPVHLAFHPNAASRQTVSSLTEYNMPARHRVLGDASVGLSLFFGTPPSSIQFERGILATASNLGGIVPEYFFNTYPLGAGGRKNVVTVLFPYDGTHAKGAMARLSGPGYTGAAVTQGSIVDTALESDGAAVVSHGAATLRGQAALWRANGGLTSFYFVRKGRSFDNGVAPRVGFESDAPVSLRFRGTSGSLVSPGADVTLHHPGITGVRLNGQTQSITASGSGWVRFRAAAGSYDTATILTGASDMTPPVRPRRLRKR